MMTDITITRPLDLTTAPAFTTGEVISADGTPIGYRQIGRGPGLVIMHGGARASQHYLRLAQALADDFTVIIPDRRGRGLSGPPGRLYSIQREIDDLQAILFQTRAHRVFGHSAGGFFALESALRLPIFKLALYEPAALVDGTLSLDWLPKLEQALARQDKVSAMVIFLKGLRLNWLSDLPGWMIAPMARALLLQKEGQEMAALLPSLVWEAGEIQYLQHSGLSYQRYAKVPAKTLLLSGTSSADYLRSIAHHLADAIPRANVIDLERQGHNAPDQDAPEEVAEQLRAFFC